METIRRNLTADKRKSESLSRKGSAQKQPVTPSASFKRVSYRELSTGKLESTRDPKFLSKLDHLQQLATWASGEACVPSLGAYLGHLYAATAETMAVKPDTTVVSCERCETILHPGINCTVRVEKNQAKRKHRYKNNVVYKCHFCSHASQKRGTPGDYYTRELGPAKRKPSSESQPSKSKIIKSCSGNKSITKDSKITNVSGITLSATPSDTAMDSSAMGATSLLDSTKRKDNKVTYVNGIALQATTGDIPIAKGTVNPSVAGGTPLLDAMKRKRKRPQMKASQTPQNNSAATNVKETSSSSGRKRKQPKTMWEGLKNKFEQRDGQSKQNTMNFGHGQGRPSNQNTMNFGRGQGGPSNQNTMNFGRGQGRPRRHKLFLF